MLWNGRIPEKEIIIEEKRDTVVVVDTIEIEKPIPIYIESKPDTVWIESIKDNVEVDIETKVYEDSTYKAQISGFKADLDWIQVYPRTEYITVEKTLETVKKQRITHGIQLGVGYGIINKKADLYVGYGMQINF